MRIELDRHWAWRPVPQLARVVVCEQKGVWARALRRELGDLSNLLVETRTLSDCLQSLSESPASIVGLEFSAATGEATLDFLVRRLPAFRQARAVVLGSHERGEWEWQVRELGAVHVAHGPLEAGAVASVVRRHLAGFPPELPLAERILAEVGWGE